MRDGNVIWRWLFLDIYVPSIITATAEAMLLITIPLYLISLSFGPVYVGFGAASIAIGNMVLDIPGGILLRASGERRLMKLSMIIMSLSTLGMTLTGHPWTLIALSATFGGGRSLWLLSRRYIMAYYVDYQHRGRASSIAWMSERLATFIGPGIVAIVINKLSYQWVFLLSFILIVITSIFHTLASRILIPENNTDVKKTLQGSQVRSLTTSLSQSMLVSFIALYIAQIAVQGVRYSRNIFIPIIGKGIGLSDSSVSLAMSISGALDVLGSYPAGVIMDKRGRHVAMMISFSIIASGLLLLALSSSEILFYVSALAIGLGNGLSSGAMMTIGGDAASKMRSDRGAIFLALWQLVGDLGKVVFPVSIGLAVSIWGASIAGLAVSIISASIAVAFRSTRSVKNAKHH